MFGTLSSPLRPCILARPLESTTSGEAGVAQRESSMRIRQAEPQDRRGD
jgi:hypothetical protein